MKHLLGFVLTSLIAVSMPAFATAQQPDYLILDGEHLSLTTHPLAALVETGRINLPEPDEHWSSNWRGYVATWSITDDQLLLTKIDVLSKPEGARKRTDAVSVDILPELFDGKTEVLADWFFGALVLPRGEILNYVHMGYASTYERYTILHIAGGRLVSRQDLGAAQYERLRKERFAAYRKTAEYASILKKARERLSRKEAENFIYQFAAEEYMSVIP